jgi:hypothetical protein
MFHIFLILLRLIVGKDKLTLFVFVLSPALFKVVVAYRGRDRHKGITIRIRLITADFAIITIYGSRYLRDSYFSLDFIALLRLHDWPWHH